MPPSWSVPVAAATPGRKKKNTYIRELGELRLGGLHAELLTYCVGERRAGRAPEDQSVAHRVVFRWEEGWKMQDGRVLKLQSLRVELEKEKAWRERGLFFFFF